jgi:hypothetical protein
MSLILGGNLFYVKYVSFGVSFVTFPEHRTYILCSLYTVYKGTVSRDEYFVMPYKVSVYALVVF